MVHQTNNNIINQSVLLPQIDSKVHKNTVEMKISMATMEGKCSEQVDPQYVETTPVSTVSSEQEKLDFLAQDLIGGDTVISTAFGERIMTYCDYVASGRPLKSIEGFIAKQVLPTYANTHTETSVTGLRTNILREQARAQIAKATGTDPKTHSVIFVGSGVTAALDLLIQNLPLPFRSLAKYNNIKSSARPVVIHAEYEHHSNLLPWRESNAIVCACKSDKSGKTGLDLKHLRELLEKYKKYPMIIGSFSAASNVDGMLTDVNAVSKLMHEYNGYAFFDYAAAAPYVPINISESNADAIAISPHKFLGGAGTPGVLIVRNTICDNRSNVAPNRPGGGVVTFVSRAMHSFEENTTVRNESGTPEIVGAIRAGCVFKLKEDLGSDLIKSRDDMLYRYALKRLDNSIVPNIYILGNPEADRLPTLSFMILVDGKSYLHPSFVSSLLNDLFGIQSRSGCMCAGPYGQQLLNIGDQCIRYMLSINASLGTTMTKPGFTRLNLPYFFSMEEIDFVIDAMIWVSNHGYKLLPLYTANTSTTVYKMNDTAGEYSINPTMEDMSDLNSYDFFNPPSNPTSTNTKNRTAVLKEKQDYFAMADAIVEKVCANIQNNPKAYDYIPLISDDDTGYWMHDKSIPIWFMRTYQVIEKICGQQVSYNATPIFMPPLYRKLNQKEKIAFEDMTKSVKLNRNILNRIRVTIPSALGLKGTEKEIAPATRPTVHKKKKKNLFSKIIPRFQRKSQMVSSAV